jgi:hypothetical protein
MSPTDTASDRQLSRTFWRYTILTHRYVGIAISLIILLWCLSGIIMMYVQYPAFDRAERLAGLSEIALDDIHDWRVDPATGDYSAENFVLESTPQGTVLRLMHGVYGQQVIDLGSGSFLTDWPAETQQAVGQGYARNRGWAKATSATTIQQDQWTVHSRFSQHRPMLKLANAEAIEWYVSSQTGEVVQTTTRGERVWNWLGSVIHWLYPTALRQHVTVWAQTVIWLTIFSLFLTITGVLIGIKQFRKRRNGRRSPYKSWALWHHYAGLIFGVLTLTWLFSGLFSMNPWGALQSRSAGAEWEILSAADESVGGVVKLLQASAEFIPPGTVRIESAYWLGEPFLVAFDRDGKRFRFNHDGPATGLAAQDLLEAQQQLGYGGAEVELLESGDEYYYSHHVQREFPVYRLTYENGERFYLSAMTGSLQRFADSNAQTYRWVFNAFHAGDFNSTARSRPVWDVFMLILLLGVTVGVATGTWLGFRRILA